MASITWVTATLEIDPPAGASASEAEEFDPILEPQHDVIFTREDRRYVFPWAAIPFEMGAPEFAPFIRDEAEVEDCFNRRPELAHLCLERADEDVLALRRAPECPDEFACPNAGCV